MNNERFTELVNELRSASLDTLVAKNAGYSSDDDKLHNFHAGADIMGGTAAQAAWGYATKHLVALRDKIQRNDFHDRDDFLEKCQDAINYICLIWCIGNEEMEKYTSGDTCAKDGATCGDKSYFEVAFKRASPGSRAEDFVEGKCPGDCFKGAPHYSDKPPCEYISTLGPTCDPNYVTCRVCWSQPYKGEELISDGGKE